MKEKIENIGKEVDVTEKNNKSEIKEVKSIIGESTITWMGSLVEQRRKRIKSVNLRTDQCNLPNLSNREKTD